MTGTRSVAEGSTDAAFDAALASVLDAFALDLPSVKAELPAPIVAARESARPEAVEERTETDPGMAFAMALNREAEGLNLRPAPPWSETGVGNADLNPGVAYAYALNREADGLNLGLAGASAGAPTPAPALAVGTVDPSRGKELVPEALTAGERLSRAVRLTREAVYAWASLLHSPAVVTIAH
jgi:hypothetical protein